MARSEPQPSITRRRLLQLGTLAAGAPLSEVVLAKAFLGPLGTTPPNEITGVPTSVAAMLGTYPFGPVNQAILVTSFSDFSQKFGAIPQGSLGGIARAGSLYYAVQGFFSNGGTSLYVVRVVNAKPVSYTGQRAAKTGLYALDKVSAFNLLAIPGVAMPSVLTQAASYCASRGAFFIIDSPEEAATPAQITSVITGGQLPRSDQAAVYFPWLSIPDPLNGDKPMIFPPSGHVAGIYANTDSTRGVWKAPAGAGAKFNNVLGLARPLTDSESGQLSALGVNCLRSLPAYGLVVWGSRTLQQSGNSPTQYQYVSIRRLTMYIEQSIQQGTAWVVFEPNGPALWAKLSNGISSFMTTLFQQGALQGSSPSQAFYVRCDSTTMTQFEISQGVVNILVGFAPVYPAEFVIIKIGLMAGKK